MKNKLLRFKIITGIIAIIICMGIFEIPCIYHPFSKHGAYDWGYYYGGIDVDGNGTWPTTCPDKACKFHHKGFWEETFSIK